MENYSERFNRLKTTVERKLGELLEGVDDVFLREIMGYSLLSGGKRLRAVLLLACAGEALNALPFACALECIHAYSLIHDDLPALDDDDFRRGKPSSHKKFGEAAAILAGDALLNFAYEIALGACKGKKETMAATILAKAAGVNGMIKGQIADVFGDFKEMDDVRSMAAYKTGMLFGAACSAGAVLGGKPDIRAQADLAGIGLGVVFQIMDDLDDADKDTGKNTFLPVERAKARLDDLRPQYAAMFAGLFGANSFPHWLYNEITKEK